MRIGQKDKEAILCLLKRLASIPAPSGKEDKRAKFICDWLHENGGERAYIDVAKNVILPVGDCDSGPLNVIAAHTDIVFPDEEPIAVVEKDGRLFAPGIGDDTANLVNLLWAAKQLLAEGIDPSHGVLIVANSCEEGLGNLKGSKEIFRRFGHRIEYFISLDLYMGTVVTGAVGSHRYRITVECAGGHAFENFGNANAIAQMSRIVSALYEQSVPKQPRTTYNVGVIEGGTTVNSICGHCSILYEYRSEDREQLDSMRKYLLNLIEAFREEGIDIRLESLGERPCGGDVDPEKENKFADAIAEIMRKHTGRMPHVGAYMSTDCNTMLAEGIPSVCIGTIRGDKMHTRDEWIETDSVTPGAEMTYDVVRYLCETGGKWETGI